MRDSMVFYKSFADAIMNLDDETRLESYDAVMEYAFTGEVPDGLSGVALAVFTLIKPQIDANNKRYEDGCKGAEHGSKGGRPKKNPTGVSENKNSKTPKGLSPKTPNENENVNVNVNENVNENEKKKGKPFTPPTVEAVSDYCQERNNSVDPETFVDFYASKGWKIGKEPMKDWKAAVRTWEKRDRKENNKASPFNATQYLLDSIQGDLYDDS